jgi:hypothetical protein
MHSILVIFIALSFLETLAGAIAAPANGDAVVAAVRCAPISGVRAACVSRGQRRRYSIEMPVSLITFAQ